MTTQRWTLRRSRWIRPGGSSASEELDRYRQLFQAESDAVFLIENTSGAILEANPAAARLYGYSREELCRMRNTDLSAEPEETARVTHGSPLVRDDVVTIPLRMHRKQDGTVFPVEITGRFFAWQGRPVHIAAIRDIGARRQAEEALAESERRFKAIFERAPVGIVDCTPEGSFRHANAAFEAFTGYAAAELLEMDLRDITHPEHLEADLAGLEACLRGECSTYATEKRYVRKDGRIVWGRTLVTLLRDGAGRPEAFTAVVQDITGYREAREALEASELFHRLVTESIPVALFLHQEGRFTYVNPAALRLLKATSQEQLLGRPILETVHPDDRARVRERIQRAREEGQAAPLLEERFLCLDGSVVDVEVVGVPLLYHGQPTMLVFANDITERKRGEARSRALQAQLHQSQKMESLGSLAGGVAHDMNNVLGAILGLASAHREGLKGDEPLAGALDTIVSACVRGRDVVRGLLYFARKDLEEAGPVDLNAAIRDLSQLLAHTTLKRVDLRLDLEDALPPLQGDAGALTNALMNLCVNAVDAMPHGGTLTLATRRLADGGLELAVRDTGCGMPPEILEKAVEPFFTTKPTGQGTGLGLSTVYGTAKAHEGRLELRSEPGRGTEVLLCFPPSRVLEAPRTAPAGRGEPRDGGASRHLRVLLVDDDELIRESVAPLLEVLGHQVETASSGEEALARFQEGLEVDLVILDMNMPGLGGARTLPRLLDLRPGQAVLMASGHSDERIEPLLAGRPSVSVLHKPFGLADLRRRLQELF